MLVVPGVVGSIIAFSVRDVNHCGALKRRISYPHLFLWSKAVTKMIRSLFAWGDLVLLRVTWVSSNQMQVLLVSLELAIVEESRV
jgi:hypothetical protein